MTKFGPETCKEIIEGIKQGYPQKTAAALAGVSESTFYDWLKRGEEAKRKTKYSEFLESVKKAREHSKAHHIKVIRKAGEGDDKNRPQWQASAWYLERMFPDEFGRRERVAMDVKQDLKAQVKQEGHVDVFTRIDQLKRFVDKGNTDGDTELQPEDPDPG